MRNYIKNLMCSLLILTLSVMSMYFCVSKNFSNNLSFADSNSDLHSSTSQNQTEISIFIRKPTYSIFYSNKIFFIDEADNLLKSYNTGTHLFDSEYLDLSEYEIIDASFVDKYLYILTTGDTQNFVVKIDLSTLSVISDFNLSINNTYTSFFAQKATFDSKDYTILTYSVCGNNPAISVINDTDKTTETFELKFEENNEDHNEIKTGLKETLSIQETNEQLHILFVYYYKIAHFSVDSIDDLKALSDESSIIQSLTHTAIPNESSDLTQFVIKNVSFAKIDSKDYLAFSFCNTTNSQHLRLYSFKFGGPTETIKYETSADCKNSEWLMFNNDYYTYVDDAEQKLFFTKITIDTSGSETTYEKEYNVIDNPEYQITYFLDEEFEYKETTTLTNLYDDPWGAKFETKIGSGVDIIKIGEAKLVSNGYKISDYDYCLYTHKNLHGNDVNNCGFIKNTDLKLKSDISPKEAGYKEIDGKCIVTVWPKTTLYSLPTIVTGTIGKANNDGTYSLISKALLNIEDSTPVEILSVLSNYYANNTQMIKVRINNSEIGYIDSNCIRNPSDVKDFVITNATIKNNNTTVYLSPSIDSTTLSFKLNAGKNVRINGKRNTTTGFTSITFNDEYGNEYSGYIETDYIKSDSWSTLQIVGCVLIAINIGLLILILIYKKNHLGSRGQKIEK